MKHLCRLTATALCLLATALFTACGNSNKKESPTPLSLSDMTGEYAGTFDFTPSPSSLNPSPEAQNGVEVSLRVEDGRIVQRGTHVELMAQGGLYRRFIEIREQAEGWRLA